MIFQADSRYLNKKMVKIVALCYQLNILNANQETDPIMIRSMSSLMINMKMINLSILKWKSDSYLQMIAVFAIIRLQKKTNKSSFFNIKNM